MSQLHAAVARAITELPGADVSWRRDWDEAAAAAIRLVLAEAQRSIEALPRTLTAVGPSDDIGANVAVVLRDVLAVFAALGDEACSWCDRVGAHASRRPNA